MTKANKNIYKFDCFKPDKNRSGINTSGINSSGIYTDMNISIKNSLGKNMSGVQQHFSYTPIETVELELVTWSTS